MKSTPFILLLFFYSMMLLGWKTFDPHWITEKHKGYNLIYTSTDQQNKKEYIPHIEKGMITVKSIFKTSFKNEFDIFIHPDRNSLDSSWQKNWNMPGFKSACWMVASGVAGRLDMLSPKMWDKASCEHIYGETKKTQQLITHELIHVYHGQLNVSPDFSNTEKIDWFVEGLATYAAGQCDSLRISEIKKTIAVNSTPKSLDSFWEGNLKYGLSGSVVMYIDRQYGSIKLMELLPLNNKTAILSTLQTTESALLNDWKNYIRNL